MEKTLEYSYKNKNNHLTKREAIERYKEAKRRVVDVALVELEELNCGHWNVKIHKTESAKRKYLKRQFEGMIGDFSDTFAL